MNPYENLPDNAFWRPTVADRSLFDVSDLWSPKFHIRRNNNIVTFGSCFAQHIGNALQQRGFNWLITEQGPESISSSTSKKFNYGVFSARTGNIYTTSLLRQWVEWSIDQSRVPDEVWVSGERFFDPFRPRIEPNGFVSMDELFSSRRETLNAFSEGVKKAKYFVFTLGLTESWFNKDRNYEYPMCPGTVAGEFNSELHLFRNQQFKDVRSNLIEAMKRMRELNPKLKFILTVSPVPLTATYSGKNVVVATMQSKSVLRTVAGELSDKFSWVDYFPSYEIINSPVFKGVFFEPNQRSVNPAGVSFVMKQFFDCIYKKFGTDEPRHTAFNRNEKATKVNFEDQVCEEELLDSFGHKK